MSIKIPTAEQLQPLYDAAVAYGKASVRESAIYRKAGHQRTPAVRRASHVRDQRYRTMNAAREALNVQFPGLDLNCPAPYVGFTGELDGYRQHVEHRLPEYVHQNWAKRRRAEIDRIRRALLDTPATDDYVVGETVWCQKATDLYRVTHTTPKRRTILGTSLITGQETQLSGPLKKIGPTLTTELLALHRSRQRALKAAGLPTA
jgi:hypothetical protein